jgi:hypothetical protein
MLEFGKGTQCFEPIPAHSYGLVNLGLWGEPGHKGHGRPRHLDQPDCTQSDWPTRSGVVVCAPQLVTAH